MSILFKLSEEILDKLRKAEQAKNRYMLISFSGWPDAGNVASLTTRHFIKSLKPEKLIEFESSDLYDLTINRPAVKIEEGLMKELAFAKSELYLWRDEGQRFSLLIFSGVEPSFKWEEFAEKILELCRAMSVQRMYLVGGVLDMVPHTRKPKISAVVNMERLKLEAKIHGFLLSNYVGPASIHSSLMLKARENNLEAISVWGHASNYIPYPNAIVALHLAKKLAEMMDISMDFTALREMAEDLAQKVRKMIDENPDLKRVVEGIERRYDEELGSPSYIT